MDYKNGENNEKVNSDENENRVDENNMGKNDVASEENVVNADNSSGLNETEHVEETGSYQESAGRYDYNAQPEDSTYHYSYRNLQNNQPQNTSTSQYQDMQNRYRQTGYGSQNAEAYYSSGNHAGYNSSMGYTTPINHNSDNMSKYRNDEQTASENADQRNTDELKAAKKTDKAAQKIKKKEQKKIKKERGSGKGKKAVLFVAAAILFGLIAGAVFQGVRYGSDKYLSERYGVQKNTEEAADVEATVQKPKAETAANTVDTVYDVAAVAKKVMPSIVSITGTYVTTYQYWFDLYEEETPGAGSGIIIGKNDDSLLVLTNYHVVENAKELSVSFIDGESVDAEVKDYDEDNDIAIVLVQLSDIKDSTMSQIKEIAIGSSDELNIGDPCVAIGNAMGYGQSVTVGYISALDREISVSDGTVTVMQTDAAINPGNSGGALVNMAGELIGVNTAKYVDDRVEGIGYVLPISEIQDKIDNLISSDNQPENTKGTAFLGITPKDITEEYAEGLNMPEGIYVYSVSTDSPAEKCGLLTGDIIVAIDGEELSDSEDLKKEITSHKPGDSIKIEYYRNVNGKYEKDTVTVKLEARPE